MGRPRRGVPTEQDEKTKVKTRRTAWQYPYRKPEKLSPKLQFHVDNENSGKTYEEIQEEFRAQCQHVFIEIAYLKTSEERTTIQICKVCGVLVKAVRKA